MKIRKIISLLLCFTLILTLSACGNKPVETAKNEEERVVITRPVKYLNNDYGDDIPGTDTDDGYLITKGKTKADAYLMQKLEEYKGQDVWFRVALSLSNYGYYDLLYNEAGQPGDVLAFYDKLENDEIEFAKSIGAMNVTKAEKIVSCSDYGNAMNYYMEITADMVDKILERCIVDLDLAPPQRIDGYSDKISDTLTTKLAKMNDTDTLEIAAVTVYDEGNFYAFRQYIIANTIYNSQYFKETIVPDTEMITAREVEKHVEKIVERLGLTEKRVEAQLNEEPDKENIPNCVSVGFNAVLTKAEILKLAENSEIKVIYVAEN